ncbi:MAG: bifunctional demethylmenaquinone methyltransferase/2-methoxy-6-polyprenyl-1,4-benzoquinol methylase UbiE [Simkaniaceae bacterium]|nr:bifunctional demethylmenaquinone methyltransferase/2-methoxy-6-polyprenyl-1,4-benzoquinol methylase UbiE [Simkaniaceae bacterium]MCF7852859.1 bifunctional demethylmenaquinone methyltransferase/2-methoxy-6-polyprenyl-1,4-benzoquinol methylase UbiE [Simkaniaceae bacterium]
MSIHKEKSLSYQLFDQISTNYDRINHILSFGIDVYWRHYLVQHIPKHQLIEAIDLACGTGDQLLTILKKRNNVTHIRGLDLSTEMLKVATKKASKHPEGYRTSFETADAQHLPSSAASTDLITMSFGIRNIENPSLCLKEMHRVLNAKGKVLILEFSMPTSFLFRRLYLFYLRHVLTRIGKLLSKNARAYSYLNETIETFPSGHDFLNLMREAGFSSVQAIPLTFGIASLYIGKK